MSALTLSERIQDRSAHVVIIGLGRVGLPLAVAFARTGYPVAGLEIDAGRVATLNLGQSYLRDVAAEAVRLQRDAGRFHATRDADVLCGADVVVLCVQTPFDRTRQPDLRALTAAAEALAERLRVGQLVIVESTTFPGTTEEVMKPILERSGLRAGVDFYLAFSPERIDPGNREFGIENTPKVVGGVNQLSAQLAAEVLSTVVTSGGVHIVSSAKVAELSKLLEDTVRAVNIALVNELAMLCDRMSIDVWEVVRAASTKPFGFMPFFPGPGVGGHCIPVDPYFLAWKAREFDFHTRFIELAAETNLQMPFFVVSRVRRLLCSMNKSLHGANILVLGAAFKENVDDLRNSSAVRVMEILRYEGATVNYHDTFVPQIRLRHKLYAADGPAACLSSVALEDKRLAEADAVVILVGHSFVDYAHVLKHTTVVFDAVNVTHGLDGSAHVERL